MKLLFIVLLIISFINIYGIGDKPTQADSAFTSTLSVPSIIIPVSLITVGVIGLESHFLRIYNTEIKEEVYEHIDRKLTIDDFTQYSPFLSVYLLNSLGIEGNNDFYKRTVILGLSYSLMGATVLSIKANADVKRPDGSSNNSFPSGYTATAFMGAEYLYQEYKDVSVWYGVAGYAIATGTGIFRIINDRHWLTDVIAGAGIGMLSTKLSYYVFDRYIKAGKPNNISVYPTIMSDEVWLSLKYEF